MCVSAIKQTVVTEVLGSNISHHAPTTAPTDLFIDTGRAAQNLNPDSVQKGIRRDWKTQRPCSDVHLNKLVYKNTLVEDTSTNVEEWDSDHSTAERELSKNTLNNHSATAKGLFRSLQLFLLILVNLLLHYCSICFRVDVKHAELPLCTRSAL